jgi:hypothetical protein
MDILINFPSSKNKTPAHAPGFLFSPGRSP